MTLRAEGRLDEGLSCRVETGRARAGLHPATKLIELTERYCVVYQTLRGSPKLFISFNEVSARDR